MDDFFADWYRIVHLEPRAEVLEKRWETIKQIVEENITDSNINYILDLLSIFYNHPQKDKSFLDELIKKFKEDDATFPMRDNEAELQILITGILACGLKKSPLDTTDGIALAVICSNFSKQIKYKFVQDIVERSKDYLVHESLRIREIKEISKNVKVSLENNETSKINGQWPIIINQFSELKTCANNLADLVYNQIDIFQEQSNILWWLMGEWSNDLKCHISKLPYPSTVVICAIELASLTKFVPGPVAIPAFLEKMLRVAKKNIPEVTLKDAINECDPKWKESISEKLHLEQKINIHKAFVFPTLFALQKSLETNDKRDWLSNCTKITSFNPEEKLNAADLSFQIYQEATLLRLID